jgi:6-phosphogluconate dehydrogenase (decarboxylating)
MSPTDIDTGPAPHRHPDGNAVSVLGTGMLGTALARALLQAGHRVTIWNRTASKVDALVASGATRALTPAEAVAASPIVIASVSTYDDVHAVVDPEVDHLAGRTLVNLSSGTPEQARTLSAWAAERGVRYLDGAAMSGIRLVGQPEDVSASGGASHGLRPMPPKHGVGPGSLGWASLASHWSSWTTPGSSSSVPSKNRLMSA